MASSETREEQERAKEMQAEVERRLEIEWTQRRKQLCLENRASEEANPRAGLLWQPRRGLSKADLARISHMLESVGPELVSIGHDKSVV